MNRLKFNIFLIILLILIAYSNVIKGEFVFDDYTIIDNGQFIINEEGFLSIKGIISNLFSGARPLTAFTFWLNYLISGPIEVTFHLTNIIIHIFTFISIFFFVKILLKDAAFPSPEIIACLIAATWALHPLQTEAVSYIVQRSEALASLFYILTLISFLKSVDNKGNKASYWWFVGILCFFLGWLSKPIIITVPIVFLLYVLYFRKGNQFKKALYVFSPLILFALVGGILLVLNISHAKSVGFSIKGLGIKEYLITQMRVMWSYLRLIFIPIGQNADRDFPVFKNLSDPQVLISMFALFILIFIAIYTGIKNKFSPYGRLFSFGILWFFIILAPTSSIIPLKDVIFEHRLYLPMLGIIISSVVVLYKLAGEKRTIATVSVVVLLLSFATYKRNFVWQNRLAFWSDVAKKSPQKARAHNNYGKALYERGQYEEAKKEFLRAIELKKDLTDAYINLGIYYLELRKDLDKATNYFKKVLKFNPNHPKAHYFLGSIYFRKNDVSKAEKHLKIAIDLSPKNYLAYYLLGNIYAYKKNYNEAIKLLARSITIKPDNPEAYLLLSKVYLKINQPDKAIRLLKILLKMNPNSSDARYYLGVGFVYKGLLLEAKKEYEKLRPVAPDKASKLFNIINKYTSQ